MASQQSRFHLVPAIASFVIPGLGQLIQRRAKWAGVWFAAAVLAWLVSPFFFLSALFVHGAAAAEAGLYRPPPVQ